jgi:hypothetical protein
MSRRSPDRLSLRKSAMVSESRASLLASPINSTLWRASRLSLRLEAIWLM